MNSPHEAEIALRLSVFSDDDASMEWEKDFDFSKKSKDNDVLSPQLNDAEELRHPRCVAGFRVPGHIALSLTVTQLLQNCVTEIRQLLKVMNNPSENASTSGVSDASHSLLQQKLLFQAERCLFKLHPTTSSVEAVHEHYNQNQSRDEVQQQSAMPQPVRCITESLRAWEVVYGHENDNHTTSVAAVQSELAKLTHLFEQQRDEQRHTEESTSSKREENLMLLMSAAHEAIDQMEKQVQLNDDKTDDVGRDSALKVVHIILICSLILELPKLWLPFWPHILSRMCLVLAKYLQSTDEITISNQLADAAMLITISKTRDEEIHYLAMEVLCQNKELQMQVQQQQAGWDSMATHNAHDHAPTISNEWNTTPVEIEKDEDHSEDEEDWDVEGESIESPSKNRFLTKEIFATETTITAPTTPTKSFAGKKLETSLNSDFKVWNEAGYLPAIVKTNDLSFRKAVETETTQSKSELRSFPSELTLKHAISQMPKPYTMCFQALEGRLDCQSGDDVNPLVWMQELPLHWKHSKIPFLATPADINDQTAGLLSALHQNWSVESMEGIIQLIPSCLPLDFEEFQPSLEKILEIFVHQLTIMADQDEKNMIVNLLLRPLLHKICRILVKMRCCSFSCAVVEALAQLCTWSSSDDSLLLPLCALADAIALSEMKKGKSKRSHHFDDILLILKNKICKCAEQLELPLSWDLMEAFCHSLQLIYADLTDGQPHWFSYTSTTEPLTPSSLVGEVSDDHRGWQAFRALVSQEPSLNDVSTVMKSIGELLPFIPMHLPIRYHLALVLARDLKHRKRIGDAERLCYESVRAIDLLNRQDPSRDLDFVWKISLLEEFACVLEMNGKRPLAFLVDDCVLSTIQSAKYDEDVRLFAVRKELTVEKRLVATLFEAREWERARKLYMKIRETYKSAHSFAEVVFVTERITSVYIEMGNLDNAILDVKSTIDWFHVLRGEPRFSSPTYMRNYLESLELDLAVLFIENRQPAQATSILQRMSTSFSSSRSRAMTANMWLLKALLSVRKFAMCEVQLHWIEQNRNPTATGSPSHRSSFNSVTTSSSSWSRIRFSNAFAAYTGSDHTSGPFKNADLLPFAAKCAWSKGLYAEALEKSAQFCAYTEAHDSACAGKAYRLHAKILRRLPIFQRSVEYMVWNAHCRCVEGQSKSENNEYPVLQVLRGSEEMLKQSTRMYRKAMSFFQKKPVDRVRFGKCACHWVAQVTNQHFIRCAIFNRQVQEVLEDKRPTYDELQKLDPFAQQALHVSLKTLSPILMVHCYLNLAELGLLRCMLNSGHDSQVPRWTDNRFFAESLYFWCEARDLFLLFFSHDATLLKATELPIDAIRDSLQRLVRFLLCCSRTIINENLLLLDLLVASEHGFDDFAKPGPGQELLHVLMVQGFKNCTGALYCSREQRELLLKECETGGNGEEKHNDELHISNLLKPNREKASTLSTAQSRLIKRMCPEKRDEAVMTRKDTTELDKMALVAKVEALQKLMASLKINQKIFRHSVLPFESLRRMNRDLVRKFISNEEQKQDYRNMLLVDFFTYESLIARASVFEQEELATKAFSDAFDHQQNVGGVLNQIQGLVYVLDVGDMIASYAPIDGSRVLFHKPDVATVDEAFERAFVPPTCSSRNSFHGKAPAVMPRDISPSVLLEHKLFVRFQVRHIDEHCRINAKDIDEFSKRIFQHTCQWPSTVRDAPDVPTGVLQKVARGFLDLSMHANACVRTRTVVCSPSLRAVPWELAFAKASKPQRPLFICHAPNTVMIARRLAEPPPVVGSPQRKRRVRLKVYHFRVEKGKAGTSSEAKASIRQHLQLQLKMWLGMSESVSSPQSTGSPRKQISSGALKSPQSSLGGVYGARKFLFRSLHKRLQALTLRQTVEDKQWQIVKQQIDSISSTQSNKTSLSCAETARIPVFLLTMEDLVAPSVAVQHLFEKTGLCLVFAPKSALLQVAKEIVKLSKKTKSSSALQDRVQLLTQLAIALEELRCIRQMPLVVFPL